MIDINLNKVCKSYGFDMVLKDIDLTIKCGEKVALIGSNGCGKSTLLKVINKQEPITTGELSIRKGISIGYLSQTSTNNDINVKEYIYGAFNELIKMKDKLDRLEKALNNNINIINKYLKLQEEFINLGGYEYETKISKVLAAFEITDEMLYRNFNTLSGGEKTICSLIKLLLQKPDVLLLDEPTNHIDIDTRETLEKALIEFNGTILFVSHDRYFINKLANHIAV